MSNALVSQEPRSVLNTMSERFGMEPDAFEATVRATCMKPQGGKEATREEFAAFLLVAKEHGLNPLTKEIYAFPAKGGGIVPVVSIDGWVNLIQSHPACDGFEFEDEHDQNGNLISCTCTMYRKDRTRPVKVTEYLIECIRATDPWKMKHRMLRHKTLIQAARYAFGFAGVYDDDEAAKIAEMKDVTPQSAPPAPPKQVEDAAGGSADEASQEKRQPPAPPASKGDDAKPAEEKKSAGDSAPPAPPKSPAKRDQTIDADPFDKVVADFERVMAKAKTVAEVESIWENGKPPHETDAQFQALKAVGMKHKRRCKAAEEAAKPKDDAGLPDDAGDATDCAADGGTTGGDGFDPKAFRDDILERLKAATTADAVDDCLAEVEAAIEAGQISENDKAEHLEDAFADAIERTSR